MKRVDISDDYNPFGEDGEHVGNIEIILDDAIAKFVEKYKNIPSLKKQNLDLLGFAGKLNMAEYRHPIYIFKILQVKVITTKKAHGSIYRMYTPPHTIFSVNALTKIDMGEFMEQFIFFEAITLHLLALSEANSLDQYKLLQGHYAKMTLSDRFTIISENYLDKTDGVHIKNFRSNLLHVRNQVAHTLNPLQLTYRSQDYDSNDQQLIIAIKDSMNVTMKALTDVYLERQQKIVKWLNPESTLSYLETMQTLRGSSK